MKNGKSILALILSATLVASNANAVIVDLRNSDQGMAGGGPTSQRMGVFQFTAEQPTGTGVLPDVFLTIQAKGTEQGYNSSAQNPPSTSSGSRHFNHDIRFSDLQATTTSLNGISYFQILLDVNEPNGAQVDHQAR